MEENQNNSNHNSETVNLASQVFNPEDSDRRGETLQPSDQNSSSKPKLKLPILIAGILILILLVGSASAFIFLPKQTKVAPKTTVRTTTPSPTVYPDPTANWKTFRFGDLELKHPNDWTPIPHKLRDGIIVNDGIKNPEGSIRLKFVSGILQGHPLKELEQSIYQAQKGGGKIVKIDNNLAVKYGPSYSNVSTVETGERIEIVFEASVISKDKSNIYDMLMTYSIPKNGSDISAASNQATKLFNQILATFKFTDQNQTVDTSNWKTYTSTSFGFSFRYPVNLKTWTDNTHPNLILLIPVIPAKEYNDTRTDLLSITRSKTSDTSYSKGLISDPNTTDMIIDGIQAKGYATGTTGDMYLLKSPYMYVFENVGLDSSTFKTILSTFKFTN